MEPVEKHLRKKVMKARTIALNLVGHSRDYISLSQISYVPSLTWKPQHD